MLQAMAAVPALHTLVHPDASKPGHECAVTLFCHGQVLASSEPRPLLCPKERLIFSQALPKVVFVSADVQLLPSRGPPESCIPS